MKHVSVFLWQGLHPSIKLRLSTTPQSKRTKPIAPQKRFTTLRIRGVSSGW